jgi:hypothetical protein
VSHTLNTPCTDKQYISATSTVVNSRVPAHRLVYPPAARLAAAVCLTQCKHRARTTPCISASTVVNSSMPAHHLACPPAARLAEEACRHVHGHMTPAARHEVPWPWTGRESDDSSSSSSENDDNNRCQQLPMRCLGLGQPASLMTAAAAAATACSIENDIEVVHAQCSALCGAADKAPSIQRYEGIAHHTMR